MKKFLPTGFSILLLLCGCSSTTQCVLNSELLRQVSAVRELSFNEPIACEDGSLWQTVDKIRGNNTPQQAAEFEAIVYRFLGIIPSDYDYPGDLLSAFNRTLSGYYSYKKKRFFSASGKSEKEQRETLLHELTHALQDQRFNLAQIFSKKLTTDGRLARRALVEGDAEVVRWQLGDNTTCRSYSESRIMKYWRNQLERSYRGSVPHPLEMIMEFSYRYGPFFVCRLRGQGGYSSVNNAFTVIPTSTQEIMHPSLYFERIDDSQGEGKDELKVKDMRTLYHDTLGEFVIFALLSSSVNVEDAAKAASGWVNDKLWLLQLLHDDKRTLVWKSYWNTQQDRREFFENLEKVLAKRFNSYQELSPTEAVFPTKEFSLVRVEDKDLAVTLEIKE